VRTRTTDAPVRIQGAAPIMSAAKLSNELLIEIFRYLDVKSLSNVSLCSHRFYDLALPIRYSTYEEVELGETLDPFIRTIFENPHLAKYVKHYIGHGRIEPKVVFPETHQATIREGLFPKYFGHRYLTGNWCQDTFVEGTWDAVTAILLLLFASSLESIVMLSYGDSEVEDGPDNIHIDTVLRRMKELQDNPGSTIPCMAKVRKIRLVSHEPWIETQLALVIPYLGLKSVREVTIEQLGNEFGADLDLFAGLSRHSHITDLTLKRCNIDDNAFQRFMVSFNSLQRFHFEHTGGYDIRAPPVIGDHLAHLEQSLEELTIDTPFHGQEDYGDLIDEESSHDGGDPYDELPSMIGSLAHFQKLKKINISYSILIREGTRWDRQHHVQRFLESLPPFLEHLALLHCRASGVQAGVPLLSREPHLKTLRLSLDHEFRGERGCGPVTVEFLEKMALKTGAKFVWEVLEGDKDHPFSVRPSEHYDGDDDNDDDDDYEYDEEADEDRDGG
jgi:hypothetical protein